MATEAQVVHKRSRLASLALAAALAAVGVAALDVAAGGSATSWFFRVGTNLSQAPALESIRPDLAVSPDQSTVAVAWVEGYDAGVPIGHVYLRAAPGSNTDWGDRIAVFSATADEPAYRASVAISGTTAHVAYVVWCSPLYEIRHRACQLPQGPCSDEHVVTSTLDAISWVDLAVDDNGYAHIVWPADPSPGGSSEIVYARYTGSTWVITGVAAGENDRKPAVAWADGYAHVVWRRQTAGPKYQVCYSRCDPVSGCSAAFPLSGDAEPETAYPPGAPVVAAADGGRVFVVWDRCANFEGGPHCATFNLLYRRSNCAGTTWLSDTFEVGSPYTYTQHAAHLQYYASTTIVANEHKGRLNPSIAVSGQGWPAVAWHADRSGGGTDYVIYYSYATSGSGTTVDWTTPALLSGDEQAVRVAAAIGMGREGSTECPDVAYTQDLGAWEVLYDSDREYADTYLALVLKQ